MNKNEFRKRYFKTLKIFFKELKKAKYFIKKFKSNNKDVMSPQFQEKIILAVCGVNSCVNCSYLHTKNALEQGVNDEEIRNLLKGELGDFPEQEAVALVYSQHWAESGGLPIVKAKEKMIEYYGKQKAEKIEALIQLVTVGNLISNTVEAYKFNPNLTDSRIIFLLTYIICLPIAKLIKISGKKGKRYLLEREIDLLK